MQLLQPAGEKAFRHTLAFFAAAFLLFYMVCPVAPQRWNDLYVAYGRGAVFAMAGIYFFVCRLRGRLEVRLVVYYTIWVFLTRLLNTDFYLQNELDLVISRILCCVILPVGLLLEPQERLRLLDVLAVFAGIYYFITALLGLYAAIFGVYFYIPPEGVVFGINDKSLFYSNFVYIMAWATNRTISAVWFYLAWCMMIYAFLRTRRTALRIPIVLAFFVFYLALAFCRCRNIKVAVSLNVAMLLFLWGQTLLRKKKTGLRIALLCAVLLLSIPAVYKSFDVMTSASAALYNALDPDIERTADAFMGDEYIEDTKDGQDFADTRDLKTSLSNLSNRREIYASAIPTFREDPLRLLIGKYSSKIMLIPNKYQSYPYWHMHNYLLQVLMLTGIPGFLLVLAFSVLLVWHAVRLFFSAAPAVIKTLVLPISGILFYGMFEIIIFTESADMRALTDFRELFFFLLAGIVLAYSGEFPSAVGRRESGA
ncbi:MAG: O-antigen ligase family protein [Oscillospiraceae bacterium]|nr:O-antigen ligase family protein [Oscillospiraceae bacterium]